MLEFFLFLKSLVAAFANYIYKNHINKLRKHYTALADRIIRNQRSFIILPVAIAFITSYPSIFSSFTATRAPRNHSYITDLEYSSLPGRGTDQLSIKQLWLIPREEPVGSAHNDCGALQKEFLSDALSFQDELLKGIYDHDDVYIHTPLEAWNNDHQILADDNSVLKTINRNKIDDNLGSQDGLLSGVVKVNGLIKFANAIRIMVLYKASSNVGIIWDENLRSSLKTRNDLKVSLGQRTESFTLKLSQMTVVDHLVLTICYSLIAIYFIISLSNLKSVRSRVGILVAFIVEIFLAIMSSATLTCYFFQGVDFFQTPLQFLPFIVIVVGIENMFRLLVSISQIPEEMAIPYRLSRALTDCGITSTLIVSTDLIVLWLIYPLVAHNTQKFLIFAGLALVIDHALHLTYFAAVLSVDLHRLELKDLLDTDTQKDSWFSKIFKGKGLILNEDDEKVYSRNNIISKAFTNIKSLYQRIKLPFSTTVTGTTVVTLFLIGTNIRWTTDRLHFPFFGGAQNKLEPLSASVSEYLDDLSNLLDRNTLSNEIAQLLGNGKLSKVLIVINQPSVVSFGSKLPNNFNVKTTHKFDVFYILEFLTLLIFTLCIALIVLKFFATTPVTNFENKSQKKILEKEDSFQAKVLNGGHFLDIINIATSNSSFIVSVGLDHKVLVWSPISQPMPTPTQLPISSQLWPITHVVVSDYGNFVAVFSKTGVVQCWSRLSMSWVWRFEFEELKGELPLESFFRLKTIPAFLQRKRAKELLKTASSTNAPSLRRNSMRSITSPTLRPQMTAFDNNSQVTNDLKEFVIVLKTGDIITVSCNDVQLTRTQLSKCNLSYSAKLVTPRMNDRLISYTEEGDLLVSTAVNNKWKTRKIIVVEGSFNNPARNLASMSQEELDSEPDDIFKPAAIVIVPFVGFIVRADDTHAELIDVQTGILIKRFKIRAFKKGTFRVSHDQPTHCRFCGSASISTFSAIYTLANENTVVMQTFKVDHRAKTSICLRVERDPREIRCVGFNQVSEHQYELTNVEGWCCTDKNELIGIKRKPEEQIAQSIKDEKRSTLRRRTQPNSQHFKDDKTLKLYDIWEGWTMNTDGKIDLYEIPDSGTKDGLLVNTVGQVKRFGHKSIVAVFGNILMILYLGNAELIYQTESEQPNNEVTGLSFINKRRNHMKKHFNLSATNFSEIDDDDIPVLSELSV